MVKAKKTIKISSEKDISEKIHPFNKNIRFIVPMPGKATWHRQSTQFTLKRFHSISEISKDLAIEDYKVQFLMDREYPID